MSFMTENLDANTNLVDKLNKANNNEPNNITQEHQDKSAPKEQHQQLSNWGKVRRFVSAALIGISLASCRQTLTNEEQRNLDTLGDNSPMVATSYKIYLNNEAQNNQTNTPEAVQAFNEPELFEVPAVDQTIFPGSRVQVFETDGYGLNIRSEAGINSAVVTNAAEGTIFKVIELVGEKDGYQWALVKSEPKEGQNEIVGYAAVDWLQVLREAPIK